MLSAPFLLGPVLGAVPALNERFCADGHDFLLHDGALFRDQMHYRLCMDRTKWSWRQELPKNTLKACVDVLVYYNHPARSDKPGRIAGRHGAMDNPSSMLVNHMDLDGKGRSKTLAAKASRHGNHTRLCTH